MQPAEAAAAQEHAQTVVPFVLTAELNAAFSPIGQRLPQLWGMPVLSQQPRNARHRCLIDTVAWHRVARSQAQVRIVWRGGETTTFLVPVNVQSGAALPRAAEREPLLHDLCAAGPNDEAIAER